VLTVSSLWQIEHAMASDRPLCVGLTLPLTLLGRAERGDRYAARARWRLRVIKSRADSSRA